MGQSSLEVKRKKEKKTLSNQDLKTKLLRETKEKLEGAEEIDLPHERPLAKQESVQDPRSRPGGPSSCR